MVPTVDHRRRGEVRTIVIAFKQAIAPEDNLTDGIVREDGAGIGQDANLLVKQ